MADMMCGWICEWAVSTVVPVLYGVWSYIYLCYLMLYQAVIGKRDTRVGWFSTSLAPRGAISKTVLFKGCSRVNAHNYLLSNRITEIWNALPSAVIEASSSIVFKRMLGDHVRASVSGLFKDPSCPVDFCPLKSSFIIHS